MRNLCVAVGLALCSTSVLAADFGLGVSAKSDDGIVYVPIDISKSFRIEPSVLYAKSESNDADFQWWQGDESKALEVGVGVFGLKQVTDAARLYFGARLAYVDAESTSYWSTVHQSSATETNQDGYRIGPAAGFEYRFGEHFSVAGEASYSFLDLEGESTTWRSDAVVTRVDRLDVEQKRHGTDTRLIFRYMF